MTETCKFIKEDKTRCGTPAVLLKDGFCMRHSPTAKETKEKFQKEKAEIAKKFKLPSLNPIQQIRRFCVECCENHAQIMFCASVDCSLWYLRFGMLPKAFAREKGEKYARLFDKENFNKGRRYNPDKLSEDMEV